MKVLQLCHKMPCPPLDGGAQAIHNTTCGLIKNGIRVKVLAINTPKNWITTDLLTAEYNKTTGFEYVFVDTRVKTWKAFFNLFKEESYFIERFHSEKFKSHLAKILSDETFDIIQLEHLYLCIYISVIRKYSKAKIVLKPQNIEHAIWEKYINGIFNPIKKIFLLTAIVRLKKFENEIINNVDGIIAITREDADYFRTHSTHIPVSDIPMGFNFDNMDSYDYEKQYVNFPDIYHLGSMDWLPNIEAIEWFIKNILPKIQQRFPHVKVHIAGKKMPGWIYKYTGRNVLVQGEISRPLYFQEDKAIMVVPLLSGSGIRAKIVEGMALGKTIISTSIGARGIRYKNYENILIADTSDEFIERITKCIHSETLCRFIGGNAIKFAYENFHYLKCAEKIISFYNKILSTG